jgi:SPP1 family predicted phage head-tail adaptor
MRAGALRHRFTLQQPNTKSADGFDDVVVVKGSLRLINGQDALRFGAIVGSAQHVVEIRHRDDVTAEWRVYEERTDRVFVIAVVGDPDDRRKRLQLFCTEEQ